MILTGLSAVVLIEIYAAVMQRQFQNTDNKIGKGFAVLGIYLFVVFYCKSPSTMSTHIRPCLPPPPIFNPLLSPCLQMACLIAPRGCTAPRCYPSLFDQKSWA